MPDIPLDVRHYHIRIIPTKFVFNMCIGTTGKIMFKNETSLLLGKRHVYQSIKYIHIKITTIVAVNTNDNI